MSDTLKQLTEMQRILSNVEDYLSEKWAFHKSNVNGDKEKVLYYSKCQDNAVMVRVTLQDLIWKMEGEK